MRKQEIEIYERFNNGYYHLVRSSVGKYDIYGELIYFIESSITVKRTRVV